MNWWQRLRHRDRLESQLDAELRFHLDRLVDDNMRAGMSSREARRQARLEFGGLDQMKEECRDARATRWAHDLVQDVRFASRLLAKDRGFTAVAVMALALGIGVNSMFFTIVNALCLRGPLRDPAGIVHIDTRDAAGMSGGISYADYRDLKGTVRTLSESAVYSTAPMALGDDRLAPERVTGAYTSADAIRLVGEAPVLGRQFAAEDDRAGAPAVAILAAGLWRRRYAGDAGFIGHTVRLNGVPTTVIGVMRDGFRFPNDAEVWLPLASVPELSNQPRSARTLGAFGRLADGTTIAGLQQDLDGIARRLEQEHPRTNTGIRMTVVPINERFTANITDPAWMAFMTAGTLVLLIACANVANLLLARAMRRSGEMAIRTSLGASRGRILRQLLVECAVLAAVGGFLGLVLSRLGARLLSTAIPEGALPSWMTLEMDGWLLAALAAVCLGTVFVFGFIPAAHTSKTSVTHIVRDQRSGGRAIGVAARRWTTGFLTLQFALTFLLMAAFIGSLDAFFDEADDLVIDPANVLTTWVTLPVQKYNEPAERARFYERLLEDAAAIGDVASVSIASVLPFGAASQRRVDIEGRPQASLESSSTVGTVAIGGRYFETFGVGVLQGRDFQREDGAPGHDSVILNQRFAEVWFPKENPIGRRVRLLPPAPAEDPSPWLTVVGVAPNIPQTRGGEPTPVAYRPLGTVVPGTAAIALKGRSDSAALAAALRERLRRLDPDLPLYRAMPMQRVISDAGWNPRVSSWLINSVSAIALLLALIGLYGVTAHAVAARSREIGIRVALGAGPRSVRWLVLRRALFQLGIGVAMGTLCTIAWNRIFIVSADEGGTSVLVVATVSLLLVGIGIAACLLPARHAVRVDPLTVLRNE
jgi:putative ABC transport system permease protein